MQLRCLQQAQLTCSIGVRQVVNWTELELRVGLRSAFGREISLVSSLPPGQQCWLPAVRAESSMLHIQPTGAQPGGGLLLGTCWAVQCIQASSQVSAHFVIRNLQASNAWTTMMHHHDAGSPEAHPQSSWRGCVNHRCCRGPEARHAVEPWDTFAALAGSGSSCCSCQKELQQEGCTACPLQGAGRRLQAPALPPGRCNASILSRSVPTAAVASCTHHLAKKAYVESLNSADDASCLCLACPEQYL